MEKNLSVLMIEDSEVDALLMLMALQKSGYNMVHERVETAEAMKTSLREKHWDIILCDYRLPQFSAPAALSLFKEMELDIPFVVVSGVTNEEVAVAMIKAGASDFITKDKLSNLALAVEREIKDALIRKERKQTEILINQAWQEWANIFQAIAHPTLILDPQYSIVAANKAVANASGLSVVDIVGKKCYEIFHGKESAYPPENCPMKKLLVSGNLESADAEIEALGGAWLVSCTPVFDHQDRLKSIIHIATDITERRRAEQLYKILAESSLAAVFIVQNGKFRYINTSAIAYAGHTADEIIGQEADIIVHPEDREMVKRKGRSMLLGQESAPYEYRMIAKDDQIKWIMQIVSPIEYEGRKAILGNSIDITEIKKAEELRMQGIERLRKTLGATVQAIAAVVETRDPYTAGHQRRVSNLARAIATEMNLAKDQIDGLRMASLIHDIGKISVPAEILSKPTKLSDIEFSFIKIHPQSGFEILKDIEFPWPIARMILEHHERIDGSGYPKGLKGDEILLETRILTVADVVEAIASHRPYRPAMGIEAAMEEIANGKGRIYDTDVVAACLRLFQGKNYNLV